MLRSAGPGIGPSGASRFGPADHRLARGVAPVLVAAILALSATQGRAQQEGSGPVIRFSEHLIMDGFAYAYGIAVGDLDGDGRLDITAADADAFALYWFHNEGEGRFRRYFVQRDHPAPSYLERHAIGDINGDGHPDIAMVQNKTGDLYWFENSGTPTDGNLWRLHPITIGGYMRAYDVALADFNGDGVLDVAASAYTGNRLAWFENPGTPDGEWKMHMVDADLPESRTVRVLDLNQDGKPDLLATGRAGNLVCWYENPGGAADGPWARHVIDDAINGPVHGMPVDMDGDGDMDVVMASGMFGHIPGSVVWYENDGDPTGGPWQRHVICDDLTGAFEAFAADLDGDGQIEVAATSWQPGGLYYFKHGGDPRGPWTKHVLKEPWVLANQVVIADLDGDGRLDIIAEAERGSNELRWWRNEGL
jgi:hypothetical protein